MKIHHTGYFVNDIEKAAAALARLGWNARGETVHDEARGVLIRFLENGGAAVELIAAAGPGSIVENMAKKGVPTPYHICYEAENLDEALAELEQNGFMLLHPPAPAPACGGKRVAFLFQKDAGLLEIVEC